ncbi:hypothetical protein HDG38_005198 [Paraburkholderia sp. WSM4177]|nr:hypothetical protein [Paraburkholderia sp. WSM4177]MBB5487108.1 hypothetical protein [Paraburkholderia sp. WSM4180]
MKPSASEVPHRISDFDIELRLLLEAIYLKYQHDFRHYAMSSLRRRLTQALDEFNVETLSQLQDRIMRDGYEFSRLFRYLTVQVSDMFRDPSYFLALREHVLPRLRPTGSRARRRASTRSNASRASRRTIWRRAARVRCRTTIMQRMAARALPAR